MIKSNEALEMVKKNGWALRKEITHGKS